MARPRNEELLISITFLRGELHRSNRKILEFFKKSKNPIYRSVTSLSGVKSLIRRAKKYGYIVLH